MTESQKSELLSTAHKMLKRSYAPYSGFTVGAALLCKDGSVFGGCNIENAAFSPSNCAERTAFFNAISSSEREFEAIAIVGGADGIVRDFCPPCGVCRQVMMEFCDAKSFKILLQDGSGRTKEFTLEEMLPMGFGAKNMQGGKTE